MFENKLNDTFYLLLYRQNNKEKDKYTFSNSTSFNYYKEIYNLLNKINFPTEKEKTTKEFVDIEINVNSIELIKNSKN